MSSNQLLPEIPFEQVAHDVVQLPIVIGDAVLNATLPAVVTTYVIDRIIPFNMEYSATFHMLSAAIGEAEQRHAIRRHGNRFAAGLWSGMIDISSQRQIGPRIVGAKTFNVARAVERYLLDYAGPIPNCFFTLFEYDRNPIFVPPRFEEAMLISPHLEGISRNGAPLWIALFVSRWFDCANVSVHHAACPKFMHKTAIKSYGSPKGKFLPLGYTSTVMSRPNLWTDREFRFNERSIFGDGEDDFIQSIRSFVAMLPYYLLQSNRSKRTRNSTPSVSVFLSDFRKAQLVSYLMSVESRGLPYGAIIDLMSILCVGEIRLFPQFEYWFYWDANCGNRSGTLSGAYQRFRFALAQYSY